MNGNELKYRFKYILNQNIQLTRVSIVSIGLSFLFWGIALVLFLAPSSTASFTATHFGLVSKLVAPLTFEAFIHQPWSLITSFFIYQSLIQLILNALFLIVIGDFFVRFFSIRKMWGCIAVSHMVGFFFYLLPTLLFTRLDQSMLLTIDLGMAASMYGLFFFVAMAKPEMKIPILRYQVSLKYFALALAAMSLLMINKYNFTSIFAHFGGALSGLALSFAYSKKWLPLKKKKMSYSYGNTPKRPVSDEQYNAQRVKDEEKINMILDKISKSGYNQLTEEEKSFLFKFKRK